MNCQKCAGPLTLNPDRDFYFCQFCGGFEFPEADDSGITILEESNGELGCTVCHTDLALASLEEQRVLYCQSCRGVLLTHHAFAELVSVMSSKIPASETRPTPIDPQELERSLECPVCTRSMETHPYYGPGNVVIDSCHDCRMIWLDHGELDIVARANANKKRNQP